MSASGARLAAISKELWQEWLRTRDAWDDAKSREFERHYLHELNASVDKAILAIEQLDKLMEKIKRDCE